MNDTIVIIVALAFGISLAALVLAAMTFGRAERANALIRAIAKSLDWPTDFLHDEPKLDGKPSLVLRMQERVKRIENDVRIGFEASGVVFTDWPEQQAYRTAKKAR